MIGKARSILSCILAMLLCCTFVPAPALAEVASSKAPAFREDCFTCSSFDGCTHLAELSTRLVFDTKEPGKAKTHLEDLGYKNVSANAYESQGIRNLADSMGVTVGMRTIYQNGVPYTLLAVITRSFYGEEWVGDFTIDNGAMHAGFKDARDEILRYLRDYVQKQNITGNLKVWIAGHSRSAAASGLVAGFLADEGNAYLGNGISLAPEDIYAYCTATPAYIVDGASKDEVLSVSAARTTDPNYGAYDTPGAAYVHTGGGTIDLSADAYKGIRNYDLDTDFVAKLPPSAWGLKRYGVKIDASGEKTAIDDMATELSKVSKDWFDAF